MNIVKYGEWEIEVDVEKTKEYYSKYVRNENQANRNFSEYCKIMSDEERCFFDSFGITPECCDIRHIGVSRKKDFPCGGQYFICGRYLKYPQQELITVEELAANNFIDKREDPRVYIGIFKFDFQCEEHVFNLIPEDIPDGFIFVRFWCENMRWLLKEKIEPDMIMYELPRFWEIGKIIKRKIEIKKQIAEDFENQRLVFKKTFEKLGINYSELSKKEIDKYRKDWVAEFSPEGADDKNIKELCLSNKDFTSYLWHIFSFDILNSEENSRECYNNANKSSCIFVSNINKIGFAITDAYELSADVLDEFIDVTISAADFSWTYCKTHEEMCGPYFYKK